MALGCAERMQARMMGNGKTWLLTRVGRDTMVRVDFDGPVCVHEVEHLQRNLDLMLKWMRRELAEALVAWGEALQRHSASAPGKKDA